MSTLNESLVTSLFGEGYTGTLNDQLFAKLSDLTGVRTTLPDMWMLYLNDLGYTEGTYNDRMMKYLGDKGYTGSLTDMLYKAAIDKQILAVWDATTLYTDFSTGEYRLDQQESDFVSVYDITRASSKYVYNSSGTLVEVPPNTPAFQHDPLTGIPLGLSVEGSATNLLTHSNNFTGAMGGGNFSQNVVVNGFRGIDYLELTQNVNSILYNDVVSSGGVYVFSVWIGDFVTNVSGNQWQFALRDQTAGVNLSSARKHTDGSFLFTGDAKIVQTIGRWNKVEIAADIPSGNTFRVIRNFGGNVGDTLEVQQAQFEAGSKSTSDISTTTSTATRDADVVTSDSATFGDWYRTSGTLTVTAKAEVGDIVARLGNITITADVDTEKEYSVTYTTDPLATELELLPSGNGYIKQVAFKE